MNTPKKVHLKAICMILRTRVSYFSDAMLRICPKLVCKFSFLFSSLAHNLLHVKDYYKLHFAQKFSWHNPSFLLGSDPSSAEVVEPCARLVSTLVV